MISIDVIFTDIVEIRVSRLFVLEVVVKGFIAAVIAAVIVAALIIAAVAVIVIAAVAVVCIRTRVFMQVFSCKFVWIRRIVGRVFSGSFCIDIIF